MKSNKKENISQENAIIRESDSRKASKMIKKEIKTILETLANELKTSKRKN